MGSWENQKRWWKVRILIRLSFPESVYSAESKENKFLCCPFQKPLGFSYPLSPKDSCCLLVFPILWPENSAWQSGWGCQNTARQKCGFNSMFRWGPTDYCRSSGELSKSFFLWLSLEVAPNLGKVIPFAPSLGRLTSKKFFNSLSWLTSDKIFEKIFLKQLYGQKLKLNADIESRYQGLIETFFFKAFSPNLKWNYRPRGKVEKKKKIPKTNSSKSRTQESFDFILVGDLLLGLKKQTEDNVIGWVGQPMISFKFQPNSLRNFKQCSLSFKIEEQECSSRSDLIPPPTLFLNHQAPHPPLFISKGLQIW